MGRKSNAYTSAISDTAGKLNGNFVRLGEMEAEIKKVLGKLAGLIGKVNTKKIGWQKDPEGQQWTQQKALYETLTGNVKTALATVDTNLKVLGDQINDFAKFVADKSKNPFKAFKGKKSVPASENFLKFAEASRQDAISSRAKYDLFLKSLQ